MANRFADRWDRGTRVRWGRMANAVSSGGMVAGCSRHHSRAHLAAFGDSRSSGPVDDYDHHNLFHHDDHRSVHDDHHCALLHYDNDAPFHHDNHRFVDDDHWSFHYDNHRSVHDDHNRSQHDHHDDPVSRLCH